MDSRNILSSLFRDFFGSELESMTPLAQAGSDRRYWRLSGNGHHAIGTFGPDVSENECFIRLAKAFEKIGGPTPKIYTMGEDMHHYLQEDLGKKSLFDLLGVAEFDDYLLMTIRALVRLQKTPESSWLDCCKEKPFGRQLVMWDLNYFKYEFVKPSQVVFNEYLLEDDFEKLTSRLITTADDFMGFMMRDCQSRNVMITADGPKFIDFQGGRLGPAIYDAVSFLWQSRAALPKHLKHEMLRYYAEEFCNGDRAKIERMLSQAGDMILFRTLQVLGAYGFRGLVQHRAHFIQSIPGALSNLRELIDDGCVDPYPELKGICVALTEDERYHRDQQKVIMGSGLKVEIFSFSYKKGYPDDFSGNGGGFMFDCRAMHNPGRYERYKPLTGRDAPVMEFLERLGEVQQFLRGVWSLTDPAVERYLSRGFSKLQIGFGCTGGQHRSVYCAEKTAAHVRELFPEADILLTHREHPETLLPTTHNPQPTTHV